MSGDFFKNLPVELGRIESPISHMRSTVRWDGESEKDNYFQLLLVTAGAHNYPGFLASKEKSYYLIAKIMMCIIKCKMPYQFILLIKLQWQVVVDRSILTGVKI